MSSSLPLVLLVDADRATHALLEEMLAQVDCKFVAARTPVAAQRLAVQMPADILVLDAETIGAAPAFVESLGMTKRAPRMLMLAGPKTLAASQAQLAAFGPVLTKPLVRERLHDTLVHLIQLCTVEDAAGCARRAAPSDVWRRLTTSVR